MTKQNNDKEKLSLRAGSRVAQLHYGWPTDLLVLCSAGGENLFNR